MEKGMITLSSLKKVRRQILSIILTLLLIVGLVPMDTIAAFADSDQPDFTITTEFSESGATIRWEYTYKPDKSRSFELDTDLEIENLVSGDLTSEEYIKEIGSYKLSSDGKLQVDMDETIIQSIIAEQGNQTQAPVEIPQAPGTSLPDSSVPESDMPGTNTISDENNTQEPDANSSDTHSPVADPNPPVDTGENAQAGSEGNVAPEDESTTSENNTNAPSEQASTNQASLSVDRYANQTEGPILENTKFTGTIVVPGAAQKQSLIPLMVQALAVNDVTDILNNKQVKISQDGKEITGDIISGEKPLEIAISIGVPVRGDTPEPDNVVNKGDIAIFTIEGFSLVGAPYNTDLVYEGTKLGTLEFTSIDSGKSVQVKITFDGEDEVFNGGFSDVSANFNADLQYVGNEQGAEDESYTVIILGKNFTVNVPALPKEFSVEKSGEKKGTQIDWKVKINATQSGVPINISGLKLADDLTAVGELITSDPLVDDIYFNTADNLATATKLDPGLITKNGKQYTLTIPEGTTAPLYIYYSTRIQDDFVTNGNRTITNTARLFDGTTQKGEDSYSIEFENKWIEKAAGTTEYVMEDGKRVAYITWFITVNHMGASLANARIIDVLDSRLSFVESQWYEKSGPDWITVQGKNTTKPNDDSYSYPETTLSKNVQLRIKTKVNADLNVGHKEVTIPNTATLAWDSYPGGVGSGSINAGIGMNPINKTAGNYDAKNHTIPWTVTVKESDVSLDLRVIDLLVYGTSFNYDNVNSIQKVSGSETGLESIDITQLNGIKDSLTPSYRQKYKENSFSSSDGVTNTVYAIKNSAGKTIADLIVASESGSTINVSGGDKSFSFGSIVTDPEYYLSNLNRTVYNTAMLFSANNNINKRTASKNINPRNTKKDMLTRDASSEPLLNKANGTTDESRGFNYDDKSVVFRLFVNQNGVNATGGITTVDGSTVGNIIVEDILPEGWEFTDIEDGNKFYLFNASGNPGSMTVGDRIDEYSGILTADFAAAGRNATFTFTKLEQPYVIFVKAKPNEDTLENYFDNNEITTVTNTLNLKKSQDTLLASSTQKVGITSQVLDKNMVRVEDGILKWTVSYRPYDVFQNVNELDQYRLIDELPEGLELYTDSQGNLDFNDGNLTVTEMTLNPSGYVSSGIVFTEQQLRESISYDSLNRNLTFTIPDKEKAYRFDYKTMVTANSGSLTNSVRLEGVTLNAINTSKSYSIANADASATMTRNGWIEIEKVNQNGTKLSGSTFTVFTADKTLGLRTGITDSQGKLILRGLPVGNYILKETQAPAGYTVSNREYNINVKKESGVVVTSIDSKTGADSNKIKAVNYLEGISGDIKITKEVFGNDADSNKSFDFTLSIAGMTDEKDFVKTDLNGNISYGSLRFNSGTAEFSLKHNESIVIKGIAKDKNYTLIEKDYTVDGYQTSFAVNNDSVIQGNSYPGIVTVNTTDDIAFTNTKNTYGDLLISKTVAGNAGSTDKEFNFIIKFESSAGASYQYEGSGGKENGQFVLDDEGKASVSLKHGESIRIKNLPKGLNYSIEEQLEIEDIYDVKVNEQQKNKETGTIENASEKSVSFVNSRSTYGNLVIKKMVDGNLGETDKSFSFILQMGTLEALTYEYDLMDSDDNVIESGTLTFDGQYKSGFSLKHGQSIRIKELPNRVTYDISEESTEGYVTVTSENEKGSIIGLSTPKVLFTNTRSTHGILEVEKAVTGNGGDKFKEFTFDLNAEDIADGIYTAVITNMTSGITKDININFSDGKASFILKHDEKLSVNLPKDLNYTITEQDYRSVGYTTQIVGKSSGTVQVNETTNVRFTNNRQVSSGGGGGGGYIPPTPPTNPPVIPPVVPPVIPPVTPPVNPPVVPPITPPVIEENTPENTPVDGTVEIPDEAVPTVVVPPTNGTVTIDEDGKWKYTPDPGFIGKDKFVIKVKNPDGTEEDILIEIDVEPVPTGVVVPAGVVPAATPLTPTGLPKTGGIDASFLYLAGAAFIGSGISLRRKRQNRH